MAALTNRDKTGGRTIYTDTRPDLVTNFTQTPQDGSSYFVETVQDGIKYGDMQLICEAY